MPILYIFSCSSSNTSPFFFITTNMFLISPQINGKLHLPNTMGTSQLPLFNHLFSTLLWSLIGGTTTETPPMFIKMISDYPNTYILGIYYWKTSGDALKEYSTTLRAPQKGNSSLNWPESRYKIPYLKSKHELSGSDFEICKHEITYCYFGY